MLTDRMIAALRCPLCRRPLAPAAHLDERPGAGPASPSRGESAALGCASGHRFDHAKQGYIFLGTGKALPQGDTAEMVAARLAFLDSGHFAPLIQAVADRANGSVARTGGRPASLPGVRSAGPPAGDLIVDLGSGPATYLAAVLSGLPRAHGLAFDVSKPALKRAAKAHPRLGAVLADTWREIPLQDHCASTLLNIFAPRNGPEMHRILHPRGTLIVVTPAPDHLAQLRTGLGLLKVDESKPERVAAALSDFTQLEQVQLTWPMELTREQADLIVHMGPNAFHAPKAATDAMAVTASVTISTWRGRPLPSPADGHGGAH